VVRAFSPNAANEIGVPFAETQSTIGEPPFPPDLTERENS
jgi:hypothetical protein